MTPLTHETSVLQAVCCGESRCCVAAPGSADFVAEAGGEGEPGEEDDYEAEKEDDHQEEGVHGEIDIV